MQLPLPWLQVLCVAMTAILAALKQASNWKINDTPVDQFTSKQFQEQASVVVNVCNTGLDIRDTESVGITGKQQY